MLEQIRIHAGFIKELIRVAQLLSQSRFQQHSSVVSELEQLVARHFQTWKHRLLVTHVGISESLDLITLKLRDTHFSRFLRFATQAWCESQKMKPRHLLSSDCSIYNRMSREYAPCPKLQYVMYMHKLSKHTRKNGMNVAVSKTVYPVLTAHGLYFSRAQNEM